MRSKLTMAAMAAMAASVSGIDFIPLPQNPGRQWKPRRPIQHNEAIETAAQAKRDRKNKLRLERVKK